MAKEITLKLDCVASARSSPHGLILAQSVTGGAVGGMSQHGIRDQQFDEFGQCRSLTDEPRHNHGIPEIGSIFSSIANSSIAYSRANVSTDSLKLSAA